MTVISLNGMYPFFKNKEDKAEADIMLDWLSATLAERNETNPDFKFMLMTHVYPANNYFNVIEIFWEKEYS